MATIKDLAEQYGLEDYEQLLGGYPNATKFVNALQSGIESHIPTTEDLQSPERMGEWSLAAALNQPASLEVHGYGTAKKIADVLNTKYGKDIDADISGNDRGLTLNKLIVDADKRNQGIGSNFLKDLTQYADEESLPMQLTAAGDFGGNKARQVSLYKKYGFLENKGKNKDYSISENMYRAPNDLSELSKYKDYVGEHSAPLGDSGAPLHNLTANENAIYPSDVYSSQANQYYGSGEPEDAQLFAMAQSLKDKPNEKVTIYRAVPKVQSNSEKAAQLEKDLANYMKRGRMPSNSDFNNKSDWYEWASNERDRLASLPEETLDPLSINHGDWVALDKKYAKEHGESALGGNYKILSKKVPARQLFTNGDSIREWGWDSRYAQGGIVKAQDQNENLGRLAEMLGSARDIGNEYKVPSWVPLAGGTGAGDLLMGKTPEEIENWSYGNAPMQIPEMSNVPQFKRGRAQSLADALTTLAPGVKATEDLPVGLALKPIKNLNQALLDKYIERGYLPEDELAKYEKNAAKMRNAGRQDINVQNAQANPEYEAYKAEYDVPFMHGTERLDRVLSKEGLDPKRATSGPMLYGTDSPEIASSYAKNKQDTSMMDDDDWNYSKAFTVAPQQLGHRGTIPYTVEQSWNYLDPEVKRDILTKAPRVGYSDLDQWEGDFVLHPEGEDNAIINQSHYDYLLKQSRGNPIKAMRDYWLDSGNLFKEEEKMSQLYRLAGYPHEISQEMAPWTKREGVLTGVSRIRNPLDTSNVDELREKVIPALKDAFKNDRSRKKDYGADSWDKSTRYTPKEWVNELEDDLNKGENSYVWTSIPDKITSELKRLGYNGIYDTGGKSAGADSHQVTIPFNPSQIRSKFAAFDPILKHSPNLLAGTALGSVLLHDDDQGYAEGGSVDKDSLQLNKPQRTPNHPTKSHIVKTMVDGKEKIIRFGEQGAETAGKPKEGESERMTAKRESFKARHAKNIAKGPSSAAYWANKVKWAEGGSVSMEDLPFNDPDQLRLYHQAMQHFDDLMENTGGSKKMGKTEARINYNTTTKGDRDRDKDLHTLIADYGIDVGKDAKINATMIKPMEAEGVYLGNLSGSVPVGEGRASLGLQGLHTKYSDGLSGYTAGYNGKVGDGDLSASYFEPADHNSAGRQVQLEYSMPFADGGLVSEFEDPAHERLYRRAMAHFDDMSAKQNFEDDDSMIASTILHPVEAAKRAGKHLNDMYAIATDQLTDAELAAAKDAGYDEESYPLYAMEHPIFRTDAQKAEAGMEFAGLAQTGAMPFAPESAGGTLGTLHKFRIGDLGYDLRFDDRKLEQDKLQNMVLQLSRPENEKRIISLANYEGYPWVTSMSDRTNVGNLHYINDRPVDVDLQGGQDYMFNNPGQVWASAQAPVNAIMKYGRELSERTGGLDPLYMPWRMAPTGGDYANMTGETMLKYMRSNMNKKEQRAVNKGIKDFIPDFKGIESEEGIDQFRNAPDKVRKALKNHLDTKYRNAGGISIGEARLAVADPSQLLAPDTGLQNVGQIYVGNPIIKESGHRAYPRGVPGQGLGVLDRDVMAYDLMPDVAEYRGLIDLKNPRTTDIRALQMKPYGGIITDKILKNLGYAKGGSVGLQELANKYM